MKTLTLSLLLAVMSLGGFAQNNAYQEAMRKNLALMDSAMNSDKLRQVAARFEQIAGVATKEWLPSYYAGYAYLMMSFQEADGGKKDALLDQAEKLISDSRTRAGDESELLVIEAFLAVARIAADPMARGMEYSGKANGLLGKARGVNPKNPRVDYLQGMLVFNTPEEYGGGKEQALPLLTRSKEKFAAYTLPAEFWPDWGRQHLEQMLQQ
ncbi:MAG: hypothetical protein U0T82_08930 [Bacteroidales bacterium]